MNAKRFVIALSILGFAAIHAGTAAAAAPVDPTVVADTDILAVGYPFPVTVMTAELKPIMDPTPVKSHGFMQNIVTHNHVGQTMQDFDITVRVAVPSDVPGFRNLKEAMNADVRVMVSNLGVETGECMLVAQPLTDRNSVTYEVQLLAKGDALRVIKGICDVDMLVKGLQPGVPAFFFKDELKAMVKGSPFGAVEFAVGYCE